MQGNAKDARQRAAYCAGRAEQAADENTRLLFTRLRDCWLRLASQWEDSDVPVP